MSEGTDGGVKKSVKEIEHLEEDLSSLNQISDIASSLHSNHQTLDEVVRDMIGSVNKQLIDKQSNDTQLLSLDLTVTTQEGIDNLTIIFPTSDKRSRWEEAFNEAKQKLALSTDRRPPPEFMYPLPIRKTRAGLQFTCSASTLGLNSFGLKDVWVCNSDGYVGQVCVLSLQPEPTLTSCNGVCNARILWAMSIPAATPFYLGVRRKSLIPETVPVSVSIHIEDADIEEEDEDNCQQTRPGNGNFQLDSESSEDEEDSVESPAGDVEAQKSSDTETGAKEDWEEMDNMQPTMWLGTEDGCIHVYNCNDNIRMKKNKMKIQHSAAVHCIIYLDNRVFVSLANGELAIYKRNTEGGWNTSDVQKVQVGSSSSPVLRMLPVAGKLWCGCQNSIKVLNTFTLEIEKSFQVCSDSSRPVITIVTSGLGVWVGIQHSAILRLFHATSYENLLEVNVAPAVTKMLSGCDNIIRQHKAACLRVTALLACKDLLWVGTSAGVILTLPLPHLTSNTTRLDYVPNVAGVPHGHTGHVRFMTSVEMSPGANASCSKLSHRSVRSKEGLAARRASTVATSASSGCRLLVISGGDGYEDFRNLHGGLSEGAGHDDSTNHLLLWQV